MKSQWILSLIIGGIFLNLFILYWLFFDLSSAFNQQIAQINSSIAAKEGAPLVVKNMSDIAQVSDESVLEVETLFQEVSSENSVNTQLQELRDSIDIVNAKVEMLQADEVKTRVSSDISAAIIPDESTVREITVSLGNGQTNSKEWTDIAGMNAYINTANYSAISSVRFEAVIRIPDASGYVHARLYNVTDKHPVWNSEVVSETDQSILKQSGPIQLDTGEKLYQVQMKSTIGDLTIIDSGRVKIYTQ